MSLINRNDTLMVWFMARPPILRALILLAIVFAVVAAGVVVYSLINHTFIDLLLVFRDLAVLAYMFFLRIGVPVILVVGIGAWLKRKLDPDEERAGQPLSERVPMLQRVKLPRLSSRLILGLTFVAALWTAAIGLAIARFLFGLSYVTNLNDSYPWGLWISFDVICGVALAAGGFVMAGTAHVFNMKRFHPIVRPAILTAFLGYLLVVVGLLFDLGRWYQMLNVFTMINIHSPMIEVAWCVILYTTVLTLEFSPVVFEKFNLQVPLKIIRRITVPLVIAGMCLSTLHQSTLGTLFLIAPEKINPLWYSPLLPVFFFISAVAVGLGMTIVESNLSARFLGQELESDLLASLGKAASIVLLVYFLLKVADLIARGATAYLTVPGIHSTLYWIEMGLGVVIPMLILSTKRGRETPRTLFATGWLIVGGVILNRFNTSMLGWWSYASGGPVYIPTLSEVTITISLITLGVVAFAVIGKFFPIFVKEHQHAQAPAE
ncbi:MAG: Ni/Fe-hydrogenase cytochrome b subunit [Chloroflexi bacterium]|nr:Ni/Fe-hydrogenase cytochrome b subunit [Chloroflexota bacterium]